jgi:hypothetical protein
MNTTHRPRASYLLGDPHHVLAALAISSLDASGTRRTRFGRRRGHRLDLPT